MELFLTIWMTLCGLGVLALIWRLICNQKTYNKRKQLLDNRPGALPGGVRRREADLFWLEFEEVTYNEHLSALFWCRNPKALYGPIAQACWGGPWREPEKPVPVVEDTRAYLAAITGES